MIVNKNVIGNLRKVYGDAFYLLDSEQFVKNFNEIKDAFAKIYLTASTDARAKRRYDELVEKGEKCDYEEIKKLIK